METYKVNVTRDEDAWMVEVPAVERVTLAETLAEVDETACGLISIMTGFNPESIRLDVHIHLAAGLAEHVEGYKRQRRIAEEASARALEEGRIAARQLRDSGMTMRDIGRLLGVSHQRASQLANA